MKLFARRLFGGLFVLTLLALAPRAATAQDASAPAYKISYTLSMPQPASHLFEVRVDVGGVRSLGYLDFQMPRWSPGRYAVFDFEKNVQEVKATTSCAPDVKCEPMSLPVERLDTQTWRVASLVQPSLAMSVPGVTLTYKVFAAERSGT